jgi:hypothetical protein
VLFVLEKIQWDGKQISGASTRNATVRGPDDAGGAQSKRNPLLFLRIKLGAPSHSPTNERRASTGNLRRGRMAAQFL